MHPYPHVYKASASGSQSGSVSIRSPALPTLETNPPPEFGGPEGFWSPETLLCAALADCFVLTFRGISRAARLEWKTLDCSVQGTLERRDGASQFTQFKTLVTLSVPEGVEPAQARSLLERAEQTCLIGNSLRGERVLETEIRAVAPIAS